MLDSELNSHDTNNETNGRANSGPEPASAPGAPAVPAALFQAPQVLFQPPAQVAAPAGGSGGRDSADAADAADTETQGGRPGRRTTRTGRAARSTRGARTGEPAAPDEDLFSAGQSGQPSQSGQPGQSGVRAETPGAGGDADQGGSASAAEDGEEGPASRRRRRRSSRSRTRGDAAGVDSTDADSAANEAGSPGSEPADDADGADADADDAGTGLADGTATNRRRRRRRRRGSADADVTAPDDPPDTVVHVREPHTLADDVRAIKGSTRLEAKKQRRREGRESGRRRPPVITESEFLARRESVDRTMVVRQRGDRTQIAVLEDGVLVEHYVNRTTHQSYVGNVYLGKVQNVLPSMEAAFVDIGKGRNAVLYAGEVNFDASGLEGQPKRIESALKPGQSVIVQVTKDPVGHKGARLTSQVSLPGRYLVYVPGASMTGISRKLPDTERNRLKHILKKVTPENAGVIVRTAAEGAAEAELDRDVTRLAAQWENIERKAKTATAPALLYGEPDLTIRVVRDVFNEDFSRLIVSGEEGWDIIDEYVRYVAPHLADRLTRWDEPSDHDDDVFGAYRIDEQLAKALERKVWLPSGGSLVIDRTEAMTVIDVNTGKFTGQGGNLEETVTRNNLEAAEEIVRQLRLRDVGGIVVIDFIDMVLESNRELVLRRLLECLARDRTKHQVAEVTSLGLVQMTRKRVGAGLLEAFSQPCECCNGRGVIITLDQPEPGHRSSAGHSRRPGGGNGYGAGNGQPDRSAQDRLRPDQDQAPRDQSSREQSTRDEDGQRSRRGRRDGRTNGGTASASLVATADAHATVTPATTPATVAGNGPAVATQVSEGGSAVVTPVADTSADPGTPVRRTRAGSAMARLGVTPEEPAPALTVAVPVEPVAPAGDDADLAPVEPVAPAADDADLAPAEPAVPAADDADLPAAEPVVPAADVADLRPAEEVLPAQEEAPAVSEAAAVTDATVTEAAPVTDASATDQVAPAEAEVPADEAPSPAEAATPGTVEPDAEAHAEAPAEPETWPGQA
jgi:ribonuclease E